MAGWSHPGPFTCTLRAAAAGPVTGEGAAAWGHYGICRGPAGTLRTELPCGRLSGPCLLCYSCGADEGHWPGAGPPRSPAVRGRPADGAPPRTGQCTPAGGPPSGEARQACSLQSPEPTDHAGPQARRPPPQCVHSRNRPGGRLGGQGQCWAPASPGPPGLWVGSKHNSPLIKQIIGGWEATRGNSCALLAVNTCLHAHL